MNYRLSFRSNGYLSLIKTAVMKPVVKFYDPGYDPGRDFDYVIIGARYNNSWIIVDHRVRGYGLPAGHVNAGETTLSAAGRELKEETGAISYDISCVATYKVENGTEETWGRLYVSVVHELGEIKDREEIKRIIFDENLPVKIRFAEIQNALFARLNEFILNS